MAINVRPKIYFGNGGFRGWREVRRASGLESNAGPKKESLVYSGGGVSPRVVLSSGGIARGETVRVSGEEKPSVKRGVFGIRSGTAVAKLDGDVAKPALREVKMVGREARIIGAKATAESKPKVQPPMTEQEKRAADFFEQVMSRKPMPGTRMLEEEEERRKVEEEAKAEEKPEVIPMEAKSVAEPIELPKPVEEVVVEPKAEVAAAAETRAVEPELPLGNSIAAEERSEVGGRRKRRRGKKNRHQPTANTEVSEEKRAELQAALEAASDAAATVE